MTIPASHMKERLSAAYVQAVAARAGIKLFGDDVTEYGIDGYFQRIRRLPDGGYKEGGAIIQCQVKATTTSFIQNNEIIYDMKVRAYNKLVDVREDDPPTFLILFRVPSEDDIDSWLTLDDNQLTLKRCCYWQYITGPPSSNKEWQRIKIPIQQRFTPDAVNNFFVMLKEGKL